MADSLSPVVIIGIILLIVLLINVGIFFRFRGGNDRQGNQALRGMLNSIKSPWEKEDRELDELGRLTEMLKNKTQEQEQEKIRNSMKSASEK